MPFTGPTKRVFSKQDIASWPEGHKGCRTCRQVLPFDSFGPHARGKFGLNQVCNPCRALKATKDYASRPYERIIYDRAKSRARRKGLPFEITVEDIVIPDTCPVLGIPLVRAEKLMTDNSPSLDRLNPDLGYVRGNIAIISNRANRIKSNASIRELLAIAHWMGKGLVLGKEEGV